MAASIPTELIEKWKSETATKTERDFEMDLWTEDSANRIYLKELIAHMEERREHVDKAFLYPEELVQVASKEMPRKMPLRWPVQTGHRKSRKTYRE